MPTITAGSVATVYCPLAGSITITPGSAGRVSFQSRSASGGQSSAPRELYAAETISIAAGDTVSMEAINIDATYTEPAGRDGSLQALVSEAGNVTSAAIRSTTGTPGQVVKLADGDDKGMLLQWLIPAGSTSYTWCWFLSPNDAY